MTEFEKIIRGSKEKNLLIPEKLTFFTKNGDSYGIILKKENELFYVNKQSLLEYFNYKYNEIESKKYSEWLETISQIGRAHV